VTPIHGSTDPRFQTVRDAFAANFCDHGEVGAALCVYVRGRCVVDLWGGIADLTTGTPWARTPCSTSFPPQLTATTHTPSVGSSAKSSAASPAAPPAPSSPTKSPPPSTSTPTSAYPLATNTGSADSSNLPPPFTATPPHYAGPAPSPGPDPNDPRVHAAEIPSSNGITTARAIARFYNTLIDPTDGYPLLAPATVTTTPQSDALDQTLGVHTRFASATPCPPPHSPCSGPALSATAAAAAHSAAPTRPDINKIWVIEEVETFSQLCLGEQPASGHV
jgi:hypothetical protein